MEQIINKEKIEKIMRNTAIESNNYLIILKSLYIFTIKMDLIDSKLSLEEFDKNYESFLFIEKVALFVFHTSTSIFENGLSEIEKEEGLEIVAIAFEKMALYINVVSANEIEEKLIKRKTYKYYIYASICYSLNNNIPNSVFLANRAKNIIEELLQKELGNKNIYKGYLFLCNILNRSFNYINDNETYNNLLKTINLYFSLGKENIIDEAIERINKLRKKVVDDNYNRELLFIFKYAEMTLCKIKEYSIWNILRGKVSNEFIKQLIRSKPSIKEFWKNQRDILNNKDSFLNNLEVKRTILNFPTSGGKTLISEIAIEKHLETNENKICVFIAPTNALVNEISKKMTKRFRILGISVGKIRNGLEFDKNDEDMLKYNIIVTTPEKFETIIRNDVNKEFVQNISLIIFDEFHKIAEIDFKNKGIGRGWILESIIWFLISHSDYRNIHLMFMSAILDNGKFVTEWLTDEDNEPLYIRNNWKPTYTLKGIIYDELQKSEDRRWVPQDIESELSKLDIKGYKNNYTICYKDKDFKDRKIIFGNDIKYFKNHKPQNEYNKKYLKRISFIVRLLENIGPNLLFFNTKLQCERFISQYENNNAFELDDELEFLIKHIRKQVGDNSLLIEALKKGIIYHHGNLPLEIREGIENYFSKGKLKTIVSTTTLAEGVNFPINNFIYSGKEHRNQDEINIGSLKNIAGRAGRAYQNTFGQVLFIEHYGIETSLLEYDEYDNEVIGSLNNVENLFNIFERDEGDLNEDEIINLSLDNSFYKTILLFYNTITKDSEVMQSLLKKSLSYKSLEEKKKNILKEGTTKSFIYYNKLPEDRLNFLQITGVGLATYKQLEEIVKKINIDFLNNLDFFERILISSFHQIMNKEIFNLIIDLKEFKYRETREKDFHNSKVLSINDYDFFIDWADNKKELKELKETYFSEVDEDYRETIFTKYISHNIEYKLSWAMGTLAKLLLKDISNNSIEFFQNLGKYSKYGLNKSVELGLITLGFNSRDFIIKLSKYIEENFEYTNINELEEILIKNFDSFNFSNFVEDATEFEIRQFIRITNNLKKINVDNHIFKTKIAGTFFYLEKSDRKDSLISKLKENKVSIKHEISNYYDENAICVLVENEKIGYIPRTINEEVLFYLELNYGYMISIIEINETGKNLEIFIKIEFDI